MRHPFPIITHISQVLGAIAGSKNFVVKDCGDFTIIQYILNGPDTFPEVISQSGEEGDYLEIYDQDAAIRRECRGITFCNKTGAVISRPFHKFFNYGEREETKSIPEGETLVLEKLDGSMIRPIPVEGGFRLATKMGITDVALQAEFFIADKPEYTRFIKGCLSTGHTPIFEWCSRKNQIILDYPQDTLVLLALRKNDTGRYFDYLNLQKLATIYYIPLVKSVPLKSIQEAALDLVDSENSEGYVCRFENGHMLKAKSEWYVRLHRSKELVSREKDLVKLILEDKLDDIKPLLTDTDLKAVEEFEGDFNRGLEQSFRAIMSAYTDVVNSIKPQEMSKKKFVEKVQAIIPKTMQTYMYALFDEKPIYELMCKNILRQCGSGPRLEEVRWMFNARYKGWGDK